MNARGFTLPELLVSLLLSTISVATGAGLFMGAGDGVALLESRAEDAASQAHALRLLDELVLG